jgi:hypothetical protein
MGWLNSAYGDPKVYFLLVAAATFLDARERRDELRPSKSKKARDTFDRWRESSSINRTINWEELKSVTEKEAM